MLSGGPSRELSYLPEKHMVRNTQTWEGRKEVHTQGERYLRTHHEIPRKRNLVWLRRQCTPSNRNARRYKQYKLHVSVATPRQMHLQGRDQHQHGLGGP